MYTDGQSPCGGAWCLLDEGNKVSFRVEPDQNYAEFNFFGSFEMSVNMMEEGVVRCRDMFAEALAAMRAARADR